MKTPSRFLLVTIFLVLTFGGLFGWKIYQLDLMQAQFSQPQPPAVVDAAEARTLSWTPALSSVGSTRAINGIRVANEVPGVVASLSFESGQQVGRGDILLRLDTASDEAALQTRRAEAQLAEQAFRRLSDLLSTRDVSQAQYDEAKANHDAAQARVSEQEAQISKKILRAPFDGTLGLRLVDLGEYLPAGTPIVEINMLDPIYVEYTVPERELPHIAVGHAVEATVAAAPGQTFSGTISAINSSVSPESRTVRVRATLENDEHILRPGMFANVRTRLPENHTVVAVPRTAISFNTYGDFVYVLTENDEGKLITERRTITSGETRGGMVEVREGLEAGERVVATGLLRLRAGQAVEVASAGEGESPASSDDREAAR